MDLSNEPGQLSIANPRVWAFALTLTGRFIEELCQSPMSEEEKFARGKCALDRIPSLSPGPFELNATPERLSKLVIEEYPTRVRAHLWLASPNANTDPPHLRYDWFDVARSPARYWKIEDGGGRLLWAYSTEAMAGVLKLSGSWEWDSTKKRAFFQLSLWFDRELGESKVQPPTEAIFKVPLDPGRLCDERGQPIFVEGVERKATEVEPFPYDDHSWEAYERGEETDWRWSWYLHMETFNGG